MRPKSSFEATSSTSSNGTYPLLPARANSKLRRDRSKQWYGIHESSLEIFIRLMVEMGRNNSECRHHPIRVLFSLSRLISVGSSAPQSARCTKRRPLCGSDSFTTQRFLSSRSHGKQHGDSSAPRSCNIQSFHGIQIWYDTTIRCFSHQEQHIQELWFGFSV